MITVTPTGAVLGATIEGLDLSRPLSETEFAQTLVALGRHGVLRFPDQHLDSRALKVFSERFAHQLQEKYRYIHSWTERDVLVWDHFGTIHRAIADYGPDEYRLMKRCQVMATKILDPQFVRGALGAPVPAGGLS